MLIKKDLDKQISNIFQKMRKLIPEYNNSFISDGLINYENYSNASTKIVYVQKEANDPDQGTWNLSDVFNEQLKYSFSRRIAEWSLGIFNNFPDLFTNKLISDTELHKALKSIAIVNVKKTGGEATANIETILETIKKTKKLLLQQISLYEPNYIICGLGQTKIVENLFDIKFEKRCYDINFTWYNKNGIYATIIDFYHPSYRVPRSMSYSLLQNVFNCLNK